MIGSGYNLSQSEVDGRFKAKGLVMLEAYKDNRTKVAARCSQCAHEWKVVPGNVFTGTGCPKCCEDKGVGGYRPILLSQDEVVKRFHEKGLEPLESYKGWNKAILTRCNKCDYQWRARPGNIFVGMDCRYCADWGFNAQRPAILYYVKVINPGADPLYKIGITNRTVRKRFKGDLDKIIEIETWHFESGAEAIEMEQDILKDYKEDRYRGEKVLTRGNEELFTRDVLGLDKGAGQLELVA